MPVVSIDSKWLDTGFECPQCNDCNFYSDGLDTPTCPDCGNKATLPTFDEMIDHCKHYSIQSMNGDDMGAVWKVFNPRLNVPEYIRIKIKNNETKVLANNHWYIISYLSNFLDCIFIPCDEQGRELKQRRQIA